MLQRRGTFGTIGSGSTRRLQEHLPALCPRPCPHQGPEMGTAGQQLGKAGPQRERHLPVQWCMKLPEPSEKMGRGSPFPGPPCEEGPSRLKPSSHLHVEPGPSVVGAHGAKSSGSGGSSEPISSEQF